MRNICIYHSRDLDGFTSAAIVKYALYENVVLIGFDYGQSFPWDSILPDDNVIMVDVSLPMDEMIQLATCCASMVWIDHHVSAIHDYEERAQEFPATFKAFLKEGIAACEITWIWYFNGRDLPFRQVPRAVELLGKYDTWRRLDQNEWDNEILPFQYGMRRICKGPDSFPTFLFDKADPEFMLHSISSIIREGMMLLTVERERNERIARNAFEAIVFTHKAICLNSGGLNSMAFDTVYDASQHKLMVTFYYNGKLKLWLVSLYTTHDDIDCSALAKSMGGGGHRKAAGFQVPADGIWVIFNELQYNPKPMQS